MANEYMATTADNPYNYYTQFDQWYEWDRAQGYHTLSLLAKLTRTSSELPSNLDEDAITEAIDEIVDELLPGLYIRVEQPSDDQVLDQAS